jgi:hypothetical protein
MAKKTGENTALPTVKELTTVEGEQRANAYLALGWTLIETLKDEDQRGHQWLNYVLGWCHAGRPPEHPEPEFPV